jgi:hypothetical protein
MAALPVSPAALKAAYPQLYSLSDKGIKAIIATAMRQSAGITMKQMNANAACFACMAEKDLLVSMAAMILNQLNPANTTTQWRAADRCFSCAPEHTIDAAIVYLFAAYFQALGR